MDKKYTVVLTRTVRETLTLTVEAASALDARFKAGAEAGKERSVGLDWDREEGPTRVSSVEREAPDPMAVPAVLKREAAG